MNKLELKAAKEQLELLRAALEARGRETFTGSDGIWTTIPTKMIDAADLTRNLMAKLQVLIEMGEEKI